MQASSIKLNENLLGEDEGEFNPRERILGKNDNRISRISRDDYSFIVTPSSKYIAGRTDSFLETDRCKAYRRWKFQQREQEKENPWLFRGLKDPSMPTVVPHVTIPESHRYTFSVILRGTAETAKHYIRGHGRMGKKLRRNFNEKCYEQRVKCIRRLKQSGLGVTLLKNTYETRHKICIMIDPYQDYDLLLHEYKRGRDELAILRGSATSRLGSSGMDDVKYLCFSPALENQLCHNIIKNALRDYDKEEWNLTNNELTTWDVIETIFPLHDSKFNAKFFREYRRRTFDFSMAKATAGNSERWAIEELRLHFGERVAFLFAFMHIYNKLLLPITIFGVVYYIVFHFLPGAYWAQYMRGLCLLGLTIAAVWGPGFLMLWQRETNTLLEKWDLRRYQQTIFESNDENPDFQYIWVRNETTGEMEKKAKVGKRKLIRFIMGWFVIFCAILQCILLVPFIQWYVYAKTAPVCSVCRETDQDCWRFVNCFKSPNSNFGSDRWVYILGQGVLLGLTIDIFFWSIFNALSAMFVAWENYETKSEFENRLIHRRFLFVWSNWFFWFLFLAFVYLPYGDIFNTLVGKVLPWFRAFRWNPKILSLDELFMTPLVVTQFLNLILETVVPYLFRKWNGRPVHCYKCQGFSLRATANKLLGKKDVPSNWRTRLETSGMCTTRIAAAVEASGVGEISVLEVTDDNNHLNATQVLAESRLTVFDPMSDYLDAAIQFSYVLMFTVVWPLLPFPAFFNNILEVRGDAFRLLFAQRRPSPRRDNSIGEWLTVMRYSTYLGTAVTTALILVYHYGFWVTRCNMPFHAAKIIPFDEIATQENQTSYIHCNNNGVSKEYRLVCFLVLEHFALMIRHLVLQADKVPSAINNSSYKRMKNIEKLENLRSTSTAHWKFIHEIRLIFDKHDKDHDDHLGATDLARFLEEWYQKEPGTYTSISTILLKYMDKCRIGKVSFTSVALQLGNIKHDRLLRIFLKEEACYTSCNDIDPNQTLGLSVNELPSRTIAIDMRH